MCCITLKKYLRKCYYYNATYLIITYVALLYKYLHYAPLILLSGTYDSRLISVRRLSSLYITPNYVMSPKARVN